MYDDLISRKAAIDALGERPIVWSNDDEYVLGERNQYDIDRLAIETVPSAQPERNKGRWVRITQAAVPEKYMCPFCHRTIENDGVESLLSMRFPFCHCGADMRGEQDV